jgi:hypothetical protein
MNDPHVESLEYKFVNDDSTRVFKNPGPRDYETPDFNLRLADDHLTVKMKTHCATEQEACALVDPFLRAWEINQALQIGGRRAIHFDFLKPNLIDLQPSPGSHILLAGSGTLSIRGNARTLVTTHSEYPAPPANFVASSDVRMLWTRYQEYAEGREPLASMAYACYRYINDALGKDDGPAAKKFKLSGGRDGVLATLRRLAGGKGRRKHLAQAPYTPQEETWVATTVRVLIHRVAEHAAGTTLKEITMADLPRLS